MQDAKEIYYLASQLHVRAGRAQAPRQAQLYQQAFLKFHQVLQVDPAMPDAQNFIGDCFASGLGVELDLVQAAMWFQKAAGQGVAVAEYNLGVLYQNGDGVKQDFKQAAAWFQKAAEQGIAQAQYPLGQMYYRGRGVKKDLPKAIAWFRKAAAAEQGVLKNKCYARYLSAAECTLGYIYAKGEGVKQDSVQAARWYRKAAERGACKGAVPLWYHAVWSRREKFPWSEAGQVAGGIMAPKGSSAGVRSSAFTAWTYQ
jgi:TPR repeat protein